MSAPQFAAAGRSQRWERLGSVGVDSASLAVVDPGLCRSLPASMDQMGVQSDAQGGEWPDGVAWWSGFGDGRYEVWGLIVDYGDDDEPDERVAQIVITMIDEDKMREWNDEL